MTPLEVVIKHLSDMGMQLSKVTEERDALRERGNTDAELIEEMAKMLWDFISVDELVAFGECECELCLQAKALINKARSAK